MVEHNTFVIRMKHLWYFIGLVTCMFLLACLQDIILRLHAPLGYIYPYLLSTFYSAYYYLSVITQGTGPGWLVHMSYMITPHQGSLIHYFYFMLGKIALITHLASYQIYGFARMSAALLLLVTSVIFFRRYASNTVARIAFFLYLFVQPWPNWNHGNIFHQDFVDQVWSIGEAVHRFGVISPHTTIGAGLVIVSVLLVSPISNRLSWSRTIIAALVSFIAGVIYPTPVFVIGIAYGLAALCWHIQQLMTRGEWEWKKIAHTAVFLAGGVAAILLLQHEAAKGFPWSVWQWEMAYFNKSLRGFWLLYAQQLGILLPLALIGLVTRKPMTHIDWFIRIWAFSGFFISPFATQLHLARFRFIHAQQWLPLSLLAACGVQRIFVILHQYLGARRATALRGISIGLLISNFTLYAALAGNQLVSSLWQYNTNIYIPPAQQSAFAYVRTHVSPNAIILTDLYLANMLPAFARVRTVIGYPPNYTNDADFQKDLNLTDAFLSRSLSDDSARDLVSTWHVDIVYADASSGVALRPYSFMKPLYTNALVVVQQVVR